MSKLVLTLIGAAIQVALFSQCDYTALTLPFSETFCYDDGDCAFVQNIYPISHTTFGCWTCLNNPHYYVITPTVDTYITLDINPTLFSHLPTNTQPQVPGFILFDGCPNNGGATLLRPWSYSGGACWDWSIMDIYCGWSQSPLAPNLNQGCVTSTPVYTGMAHEVSTGFNLQAGHEYWFCIFPQGGCPPFTSTCTWGCITVSFSGLSFLDLIDEPPEVVNVDEPSAVFNRPRKIIHPRYGFLIIMPDGRVIDSALRQVIIQE